MGLEFYQNQGRYWLCCPCEPPIIDGGIHLEYFAGGHDPSFTRGGVGALTYPSAVRCAKFDNVVYTETRTIAGVVSNYRIEFQLSQDPVTNGILQPIDDAEIIAASGTYTRTDGGTITSTTLSMSGSTLVANCTKDVSGTVTTALWHGVMNGQHSIAWAYQSGDSNTITPDDLWDFGNGDVGAWYIYRVHGGGTATWVTTGADNLNMEWTWSSPGWDTVWVMTRDYPNQVQSYHTDAVLNYDLGIAIAGDARYTLYGGGSPTKYADLAVTIDTWSGSRKYSELQTLAYQTESCLDFVNVTAAGETPFATYTNRIAHI